MPTRYPPDVELEEVDRGDVVMRISATPDAPTDGAELAEEILTVAQARD